MASLADIVRWLDHELRTADIPDYPGALNGLQFGNGGRIERVVAAVDFSSATVAHATAEPRTLLLVHHGMFWGGAAPIVGVVRARIASLCEADTAVYASHLPLDTHPQYGNNALLARALGLEPDGGFARHATIDVGVRGSASIETATIVERARAFAEPLGTTVVTTPVAPGRMTHRWGLCTGAGASSATLREARELGLDTLIVGEGPHHTAVEARDHDIALIYAGHYATETLGVRALAEGLGTAFGIPFTFAHEPTGL